MHSPVAPEAATLEETLRRINYLLNHMTRSAFCKEGITLPRFWALLYLSRQEWTSMGELQAHLLTSPGSVTTLIDGLVSEGLVVRQRSDEDRRLVLLALTPSGAGVLERVITYRRVLLHKALEEVTGGNAGVTGEMLLVLGKILDFLADMVKKPGEEDDRE